MRLLIAGGLLAMAALVAAVAHSSTARGQLPLPTLPLPTATNTSVPTATNTAVATATNTPTPTPIIVLPSILPATDTPATEVVGAGEFGVAETGSVAVDEARGDRGMCFLAERLWLLVPEGEMVPNLDAAMLRMRELVQHGSSHPLLMSGPSRTADIERVLTVGVHGPRALVIVVIGHG